MDSLIFLDCMYCSNELVYLSTNTVCDLKMYPKDGPSETVKVDSELFCNMICTLF